MFYFSPRAATMEIRSSTLLDACFRRALELIWNDPQDRTCGEVKRLLVEEFGVKVVAEMQDRLTA